jgi:hypothetical protein
MQLYHKPLIVWGARIGSVVIWLLVLRLMLAERAYYASAWGAPMTWINFLIIPTFALLMLALLIEVITEEWLSGAMHRPTRQFLFWMPRVLGVLFCLTLAPLALDVFDMDLGFWQTIGALLIHLAPELVLLALLAVAWRWEWLGAIAFGLFGVWTLSFYVKEPNPLSTWILIVFSPLFIAALWALNWIYHAEVRGRSRPIAS